MRRANWSRLAATVAATALGLGSLAGCGGDSGDGPAKLRFLSLAWQEESVKAYKEIVKAWNKAHPDIQVEYVQGSWDSAHDQLLTSFEGDDAPDVIHYGAALAGEFADRGYLANLSDLLPEELKSEIGPKIWDTVTTKDGAVFGVPFLLESQVVLANKKLLDSAGIKALEPDASWTWDEFADNARKLTKGKRYGAAWAMKQPVNRVMNLSLNYGGGYFDTKNGRSKVTFGAAEAEVPRRIHDMVYKDKSAAPSALSMGATDPLPGFFAGKYAMLPGSIYLRQQMVEEAPEDFDWVTLPALTGDSQDQAANPQTLSIAETSEHKEQAMEFMSYFLSPKNMAEPAMGDWLVPTGKRAGEELLKTTGGKDGWDVAVASADSLVLAPFQRVPAYSEWKTKIATPAFQEYFANKITLDELRTRLVKGGERVLR